jgi:DNA-binding transcriptional ArsR family regulator
VNEAMQKTSHDDPLDGNEGGAPLLIHDLCRTVRAISHEQRLAILVHLSRKECSVGELERMLDLPQPAVSQQLARLRSEGLVLARRDGRTIYYCAHRQRVGDFLAGLNRLLV